jgi:glycosyltransferase involved in cell wall biosynthesis
MRILHVINTVGCGGAENHLLDLMRCQRTGAMDVSVAFFKEAPADAAGYRENLRVAGISVLPIRARFVLGRAWQLRRLIMAEAPDIVHSHLPWGDLVSFLAVRVLRAKPRPRLVMTLHNRYETYRRPIVKSVVRLVYGKADMVLVISEELRSEVRDRLGVRPRSMHVVPYGLPQTEAREKPVGIPLSALVGQEQRLPPIVGTVARLTAQKGLDVLLHATSLMPKDVRLMIVGGDYGEGAALRDLAASLGISDRVFFMGFVPQPALLMAQFTVFCLPSRWEGFGLVLLEAGSLGLPVVATNIAPINEIIIDGETGVLVPPDDPIKLARALAGLLADQERASRLADAHRSRVATVYSSARMTDTIAAAYREALARN